MASIGPDPRTLAACRRRPATLRRSRRRARRARGRQLLVHDRRPGPGRPAAEGRAAADVAIVGAGFTGLWAAIRLLETEPSLRVVVLEADRVGRGRERAQRRLLRRVADPRPRQRPAALPRRDRRPRGGGPPKPRGAGRVRARRGHRLRPRADRACSTSRPSRGRSPELEAWVELVGAPRDGARVPGPRRRSRPRSTRRASSPGVRGGADRTVMLNPAKLAWGLAAAAERRGATIAEETRGHRRCGRRAGGVAVEIDGRRDGRRGARARRDVRVQRLDAAAVAAVRARLRLRAHDRAADAGAAGVDRLGAAARACPTRATSSTTSGSRPTTGSCGAATTRSTTRATACPAAYDQRPATFEQLARQFVETFPQLDGIAVHPRVGRRDRHHDPVHGHVRRGARRPGPLRARLHGPRRRLEPLGGRHPARPPARPDSPLLRPRARPLAPVPDPARADPHARGGAHAPRGHRRRRRTRAAARCSCARWTRSGSASTPSSVAARRGSASRAATSLRPARALATARARDLEIGAGATSRRGHARAAILWAERASSRSSAAGACRLGRPRGPGR